VQSGSPKPPAHRMRMGLCKQNRLIGVERASQSLLEQNSLAPLALQPKGRDRAARAFSGRDGCSHPRAGTTWWSGSACGQWDNYCSQTPDQIAAVMANNPPWTNNGAPTRPDRIEVMGAGTPRPRVGTYHKAARACAVTGAQNGR
jgi:hypothetical protein